MRSLSLAVLLLAVPALAQDQTFPSTFQTQNIATNGTTIYVRIGGKGPPVVLLHGFADTGDMWPPLATVLAKDHRVIVPDLRGIGLSSKPEGGYEKKNQARDIAGVLDALKIDKIDLVAHDIGNMVAYAFCAQYPVRVKKLVLMDAPLPGLADWTAQLLNPLVWHFNFRGPDVERLVARAGLGGVLPAPRRGVLRPDAAGSGPGHFAGLRKPVIAATVACGCSSISQ